jgi:hypothetical protein
MNRDRLVLVVVLCMAALLVVRGLPVWAQAEHETDAPAISAAPAEAEQEQGGDTWRDATHYLGIAAGCFAVLALLVGITLLAGVWGKEYTAPWRVFGRGIHLSYGIMAVTLGLAHFCLRWWQGHIDAFNVPVMLGIVLVVLAKSGWLRAFAPPVWQKRWWKVFIWTHRVCFTLVLVLLIVHAVGMYHEFVG